MREISFSHSDVSISRNIDICEKIFANVEGKREEIYYFDEDGKLFVTPKVSHILKKRMRDINFLNLIELKIEDAPFLFISWKESISPNYETYDAEREMDCYFIQGFIKCV